MIAISMLARKNRPDLLLLSVFFALTHTCYCADHPDDITKAPVPSQEEHPGNDGCPADFEWITVDDCSALGGSACDDYSPGGGCDNDDPLGAVGGAGDDDPPGAVGGALSDNERESAGLIDWLAAEYFRFLAVRWDDLRNLILTRAGRSVLRSFVERALILLGLYEGMEESNERDLLGYARDYFWVCEALPNFDGHNLDQPQGPYRLNYRFTAERRFPHTQSEFWEQRELLPLDHSKHFWDSINQCCPSVSRDRISALFNLILPDHMGRGRPRNIFRPAPKYTGNWPGLDPQRNSRHIQFNHLFPYHLARKLLNAVREELIRTASNNSVNYWLRSREVQFTRIVNFIIEMMRAGITNDDQDVYPGPIPDDILPNRVQRIMYDDNAYREYLEWENAYPAGGGYFGPPDEARPSTSFQDEVDRAAAVGLYGEQWANEVQALRYDVEQELDHGTQDGSRIHRLTDLHCRYRLLIDYLDNALQPTSNIARRPADPSDYNIRNNPATVNQGKANKKKKKKKNKQPPLKNIYDGPKDSANPNKIKMTKEVCMKVFESLAEESGNSLLNYLIDKQSDPEADFNFLESVIYIIIRNICIASLIFELSTESDEEQDQD